MSLKIEACDQWFSKCVRKRANWRCEHCSKQETLQCAHIYGRRAKSVRWDGMNAVSLCATCHRYFTENPLEFDRWLRLHLGHGHLDLLREKRNQTLKTTKALRKEVSDHYRQQFRTMDDGGEFESWI